MAKSKKKNAVSDDSVPEPSSDIQNEENHNGEEQGELPNMPASSPVGKAARVYLKIRQDMDAAIETFKEKKGVAIEKLVEEMDKIGRDSICVDGHTIIHERIEQQDKIKVKRPKIAD